MNIDSLIQYGNAKKPFHLLTKEELPEVHAQIGKTVRERAWAVGSPVYYGMKGLIIAEYEGGRKMVVEKVSGQLIETREYHE